MYFMARFSALRGINNKKSGLLWLLNRNGVAAK